MKRNLAILLTALLISAGTTTMVFAKTSGGSPDGRNASKTQYGCPAGTYGDHCLPPSGCSHGSSKGGSHRSHTATWGWSKVNGKLTYGVTYSQSHGSETSCSQSSSGWGW